MSWSVCLNSGGSRILKRGVLVSPAVGLWPQTSLTHRKSACRVCSYDCADLLSIVKTKAAFQKRVSMEPMEPPLDPPLLNTPDLVPYTHLPCTLLFLLLSLFSPKTL